jgi:KDO2-lipid IV(A) lauroyltransferase
MAKSEKTRENFLAPRFWGTWVALGILRLLGKLSLKNQVRAGTCIGNLGYLLAKRRRKITEVNICLCFPELDEQARKKLVKDCIIENAIGLVETARVWFADPSTIDDQMEVLGFEHVEAGLAQGRGLLVIGGHYSTLDIGALMTSRLMDEFYGMYRPQKNPLMDKTMREARLRLGKIIDRQDMRTIVRALKTNKFVWYAPDQDYGAEVSVFAPFFGIPAATIKTTTKLAQINNSPVLVVSYHRKADNSGYVLRFNPILDDFPTGDEVADATRINRELEREIRRCPEQYMWVHRRFKTRPPGEPGFY